MDSPSAYLNHDNTGLMVREFVSELVIPRVRDDYYGSGESQFAVCVVLEAPDLEFEEAVLLEKAFCLPGFEVDPKYQVNATAKARSHHRTGHSSGELVSLKPALLRSGDCIWGGSASVDGIIVAVSGFKHYWDVQIAGQIAYELAGRVMHAHLQGIEQMRANRVAILS
ncbi:MAG: hypothetical protein AAB520_03105 [Patescibacteria group bacterium]